MQQLLLHLAFEEHWLGPLEHLALLVDALEESLRVCDWAFNLDTEIRKIISDMKNYDNYIHISTCFRTILSSFKHPGLFMSSFRLLASPRQVSQWVPLGRRARPTIRPWFSPPAPWRGTWAPWPMAPTAAPWTRRPHRRALPSQHPENSTMFSHLFQEHDMCNDVQMFQRTHCRHCFILFHFDLNLKEFRFRWVKLRVQSYSNCKLMYYVVFQFIRSCWSVSPNHLCPETPWPLRA